MSSPALASQHDVLLVDLDGVVYTGPDAVPHAVESLRSCTSDYHNRIAYVTNNANRTPAQVVDQLRTLGLTLEQDDVVTSAQAGAGLLTSTVPSGSRILVVGGEGLRQAVTARGFQPVDRASDGPAAVIQGFSPDVSWRQLAEAAYALSTGIPYVATNTDMTIPTGGGIAPGNGTLVAAVARASGATPTVAGKPEPPLLLESVVRTNARQPLVIGDRLDTDIRGATRAGLPSMLVFTGVSGVADLLVADPEDRPTHLAADLRALGSPKAEVCRTTDHHAVVTESRCGAMRATMAEGVVAVSIVDEAVDPEWIDGVRSLVDFVWACRDMGVAPNWQAAVERLEISRTS